MSADTPSRVSPSATPANCLCGHPENVHVPFPACGDLGWYGCTPIEQAIRGYVSRLQSERLIGTCGFCNRPVECHKTPAGDLRFYDDDGGDLVPHECAWLNSQSSALESLRSQLSRIQQTGLTAEEASVVLEASEYRTIAMEKVPAWYSATSKLRSLAALRSLEGEGK